MTDPADHATDGGLVIEDEEAAVHDRDPHAPRPEELTDADAADEAREARRGPQRRIPADAQVPREASEGDALDQIQELPDPYHDGDGLDAL